MYLQKYKRYYNKKSGNNRKTWAFYKDMDEIFGNWACATPKYLAEVSSGLSSSSSELSNSSSSLTSSTEPKRKRKSLLQDLMNETRTHYEERKTRDKKKLKMFGQFRKERLKMHEEKMTVQKQLLQVMTQIYSIKNTDNE
ncbi:uncharacterized protein LOC116852836 [Odontomachus brunneus]|uniref:uncharacterized protein LOC116852836 n=1 Tax=Odontomachus brunneus TaxID=486640 RepID=UPI0013F23D57|nr:uncharacterized protein LOC116852836 [Odontomachus brunneus]